MPEGPSILILKEAIQQFIGCEVTDADCNNGQIDPGRLVGHTLTDIKSWGKHLLLCFDDIAVRVHLMMFGSYRINEDNGKPARLYLRFGRDKQLNFYASQLKMIDQPLDEVYDWSADIMSKAWDSKKAISKMKEDPEMLACDALMDQQIFSGVGNIIKNEALYRARIHPESLVNALPPKKLQELIEAAITYSWEFKEQKQAGKLKKNWHAYDKKICERDKVPFIKRETGRSRRASYYCELCMVKYGGNVKTAAAKPKAKTVVKQKTS